MNMLKSIGHLLFVMIFSIVPLISYGDQNCDIFANPGSCLNMEICHINKDQFEKDPYSKKYISAASQNPLNLKIEITEKEQKVFVIRFVRTTSREIASYDRFEKFKNHVKSFYPGNWEKRVSGNGDGISHVYENSDIMVAIYQYSIIMYSKKLKSKL